MKEIPKNKVCSHQMISEYAPACLLGPQAAPDVRIEGGLQRRVPKIQGKLANWGFWGHAPWENIFLDNVKCWKLGLGGAWPPALPPWSRLWLGLICWRWCHPSIYNDSPRNIPNYTTEQHKRIRTCLSLFISVLEITQRLILIHYSYGELNCKKFSMQCIQSQSMPYGMLLRSNILV